jgi:hypothetical protein
MHEIPKIKKRGTQTGASLPQLFPGASAFFQFFFSGCFASYRTGRKIHKKIHRNHALTKFFVLSNIRFVSWGAAEMLRASRCFRIKLLQSDGPLTLAADAPFLIFLSSLPEILLRNASALSSFSSAPLCFRSKTRFHSTAQLVVGKRLSEATLSSRNTYSRR